MISACRAAPAPRTITDPLSPFQAESGFVSFMFTPLQRFENGARMEPRELGRIVMWKLIVTAGAATLLFACNGQGADAQSEVEAQEGAPRVSLKPAVKRNTDPAVGRALFIEKGCVICHAVNGVGGKAAPPLDAAIGDGAADPLEFAARMWRGAPAMIELQSVELGYTIYLTADEIANLAAFSADREAQRHLTPDSLPESLANSLLDERFWEMEDWDDYLSRGREGELPPAEELPESQ